MSVRIKTGFFCLIELLRCMQLDLMRLKFRFYWRVHWSTNYNTPSPPGPSHPVSMCEFDAELWQALLSFLCTKAAYYISPATLLPSLVAPDVQNYIKMFLN